jgi:ParB family transcriptional regulator, chromosome partitioning protein
MIEKKAPRSGLGRGLSALMADVGQSSGGAQDAQRPTLTLPVEVLFPNPNQPRRDFDVAALQELSDSIRQKGVVQPLIVRPSAVAGQYEIVAGERRWRAAQLAELHQVPVLVREYSDEEVLEIAIIENIQRADLNALEEALAFQQLMERFGHTQEKLAATLSRSRSHIANTLRLLSLPESVQKLLRDGELTAGHARALITSEDSASLAREVVRRGLSVRETERLAKRATSAGGTNGRKVRSQQGDKDADTKAIEADLSANLRMLVSINHNGPDEGGTLSVRYRTLEDLDLLCDVLSKIPRDVRGY